MTDLNLTAAVATDVVAPMQQDGTKAVLRTWLKKTGEQVQQNEPVAELETDKVVVEVCAPCAGLLETLLQEDSDAAPGQLLGRIAPASTSHDSLPPPQAAQPQTARAPIASGKARLSPSVRRLIAEHDLDPDTILGTGRGGRLTRHDVVSALVRPASAPSPKNVACTPESVARPPSPQRQPDSQVDAVTRVPHSSMRRRIAEHMLHSVTTAPHVTAVFEVDFSAIIRHREQHKVAFAKEGVKLTLTAYFVAAASQAMAVVPEVNSRWHTDHLEVHRDINIGIGASLGDKGLIVPVIHRTQERSLLGIASRLQVLTEAARTGKLQPEDVQGGTFTISNHGVSGSIFATPIIINQPQSAILGIGALEKRVVVKTLGGVDSLQICPMTYVSLTIDHRVLDGSQTNAWLSRFVECIQSWPLES
ncbi:dihydrolipoamide acetyltransferase family protein [Pseudomonas sp. X10]